ncbi:MAG TPA: hypothetical protein VIG92_07560 [Rhodospirillales bacterium]
MRRRRAILALVLAPVLIAAAFATTAGAAEPPPAADEARAERTLLRHLHFDYGLVIACGLADDEVEAGYQIRTSKLEQRLGIEDDAEARYRELNLGWTEADADWAAKGGPAFLERCRNEAAAARDRFKQAFKDTGEKLNPRPKEKRK